MARVSGIFDDAARGVVFERDLTDGQRLRIIRDVAGEWHDSHAVFSSEPSVSAICCDGSGYRLKRAKDWLAPWLPIEFAADVISDLSRREAKREAQEALAAELASVWVAKCKLWGDRLPEGWASDLIESQIFRAFDVESNKVERLND